MPHCHWRPDIEEFVMFFKSEKLGPWVSESEKFWEMFRIFGKFREIHKQKSLIPRQFKQQFVRECKKMVPKRLASSQT
jgi:hypothetical protein